MTYDICHIELLLEVLGLDFIHHPSYIEMYESHTVIYLSNKHQFRDGAECPHFLSHAQSLEIKC